MASKSDVKTTEKPRKKFSVVTPYLLVYNLLCCLSWAWCLHISIKHILAGTYSTLYEEVEVGLKVVQTAAVMEIIHSLLGLVKSPVATTAMQVFSRVWIVWAVMHVAPPAQTTIFATFAITSWSLVEVPRYLFYAVNLVMEIPYPLLWLRYSLFAVLYPTGITGELGCMYAGALYLLETQLYTIAPIASAPQIKLSLFLVYCIVAVTYIPGSPTMYGHMVKARKKALSEASGESPKSKKH